MIGISTLHFAIRLLLAIAMGATVGLERQWRQRMAGIRTNALVVAGAADFVMCGLCSCPLPDRYFSKMDTLTRLSPVDSQHK
jgi:uncharacterized membrane protein YhiD involved in acid resistance